MPTSGDDSLPSRRRMSSGLTLYFLWVLEWPTRPILAVNCRPQSSQVKGPVSVDSAAGTDWLVEPFRRLRFSTAVAMRTSSKCCTPVRQAFCHLDLLPARSSQVAGSMLVDSRLAFKLSLKRSSGRQLGRVPDSNSAKPLESCCLTFCGHGQHSGVVLWWRTLQYQIFHISAALLYWVSYPAMWSYATQTTHVELIKTAYMTSIGDPRLAAVQKGGDDYSFIDCNFCAQAYTTFLPEADFQSAECCTSSTCAPSDVVINLRILWYTAEVAEFVNYIQRSVSDKYVWLGRWGTCNITSVFFKLIVRPKRLAALAKQSMSLWIYAQECVPWWHSHQRTRARVSESVRVFARRRLKLKIPPSVRYFR